MKKVIISLFIVATLLSPFSVSASTEQELKDNLISMLQQVIVMLQQQIADILAAQASTTSVVLNQAKDIQSQASNLSSGTTLTPIQQDTLNIVQGAVGGAVPVCNSNWQCDNWTVCSNSSQTRKCNDLNNCGVLVGKPVESQSCVEPLVFTETPKLVWRNGGLSYITWQTNRPSSLVLGPIIPTDKQSDGWTDTSTSAKDSCGIYGTLRTKDHSCLIKVSDKNGIIAEYSANIITDSIDLPTN